MIGKLKQVPLREIWKNEARNFTVWLEDNIDALNQKLGLQLTITDREKVVGGFSLDLLAEDEQGGLVIIENQLEKTDHTHLGQMVTYLTNLSAKIAIWICSEPREEHIKAVSWLNESTPVDISFYLIKIEAVQIGESEPAPLFTIVVAPSTEMKDVGREKKEYAERHYLRKEFWTKLLEKARVRTNLHANISPGMYHYIQTSVGISGLNYVYVILNHKADIELYIDRGNKKENKKYFDKIYSHKKEIERNFGSKLTWQRLDNKRASRIKEDFIGIGLRDDKGKWNELQDKMIDAMIRFEKALKPFIKELK